MLKLVGFFWFYSVANIGLAISTQIVWNNLNFKHLETECLYSPDLANWMACLLFCYPSTGLQENDNLWALVSGVDGSLLDWDMTCSAFFISFLLSFFLPHSILVSYLLFWGSSCCFLPSSPLSPNYHFTNLISMAVGSTWLLFLEFWKFIYLSFAITATGMKTHVTNTGIFDALHSYKTRLCTILWDAFSFAICLAN